MARLSYDSTYDQLYIRFSEHAIQGAAVRTHSMGENLHFDLDGAGNIYGVEINYPVSVYGLQKPCGISDTALEIAQAIFSGDEKPDSANLSRLLAV